MSRDRPSITENGIGRGIRKLERHISNFSFV
jgi:hypothetical protein